MSRPALAYRDQLVALAPPGPAWPREPGSTFVALLDGFAQELARVDLRAEQLLEETDPRTAYELLGDWEVVLGLPDRCTAAATTLAARRLIASRKLAYQAGQTPAFYIALAASLGFEIEIHEFDPGVAAYDSSLSALIAGGRWRYVWRVHVLNAGDVTYFRAGDAVGGRLLDGDAAIDLECILSAAKPAHTRIVFSYPDGGLDTGTPPPEVAGFDGGDTAYATPIAIAAGSHITGSFTSLSAGPGAGGSTSVAGTTITYSPRSGFYGDDSFSYAASGAGGTSSPATITVTVGNPPAPTVSDLSGITVPRNAAISINLAPQIAGVHTGMTAGDGAHGTTIEMGDSVTFTPAVDYVGPDSFTFSATGPGGTSSTATVSLTVAAAPSGGGGGGGGDDGGGGGRTGDEISG